ncbi:MAG: leucine--tRNA ligase [Candidatus Ancillula sp.]|jgi:leucyl-tRNA synthetase|nr:leucine--tRNA ligase [Candidatus Ancillula sp.]
MRYDAGLANKIEAKWQRFWKENNTFVTPDPDSNPDDPRVKKEPYVVMDMFPYPSGAGLHVGHPLGYIATDVTARFMRMTGKNVLHALGYDAFGLPAEQHAIKTGQHPRINTENNMANMRHQLSMLGLAHDPSRTFATIEPEYMRWTQWIFSKIYDSYFDKDLNKARPISELIKKHPEWDSFSDKELSDKLNEYRLAYISESPVNWCPGLGTVLANEEVTAEGRSERGNFPVFKKKMKQWSMRITAYADRLDSDLAMLDWTEKVKAMQHNWIGKSHGAYIEFSVTDSQSTTISEKLKVFTTRPDTLRGATFAVIAPEHPLVQLATEDVANYVEQAKAKSAVDRQQDAGKKTGVFSGLFAINPINNKQLPIYIADYVLMGYGTGAIMAVPADDKRDHEFAETFEIEIAENYEKFVSIPEAIKWIEEKGCGEGTTTYRLRDWLFSRQRYWGEPFPIVYDEEGIPYLLPDNMLPVLLPDVPNYEPRTFDSDDENSEPEPPLGRNDDWVYVELDLQDGKGLRKFRRETNTMPNWAGSCWYYLRYLNAKWSGDTVVDPKLDKYWLSPNHNSTVGKSGGVDLYVGGVEHAVLHLLYARFWHKVLFDLGYVSSPEPFHKLFNQGYIQAYAYTDSRGVYVPAAEVEAVSSSSSAQAVPSQSSSPADLESNTSTSAAKTTTRYFYKGEEVFQEYGKMGKSLLNVVTPDEIAEKYGADTFRIYEMSMGPLDLSRPWETRAVVGAQRYLQRLWRLVVDEETDELIVLDQECDFDTYKVLNKTIEAVRVEMENIRPNTAISKLIVLANRLTGVLKNVGWVPREAAEAIVLMTAPLAPHIAEELWQRLGHTDTITYADFPKVNEKYLKDDTVKVGVQINGKVRSELEMSVSATKEEWEKAALGLDRIQEMLDGKAVKKVIVVPGRIVNIVA